MSLLSFHHVRMSFGTRRVLEDLIFSVEAGEVYGLLGPNGSGKSTAINILSNLLDPESGTVEIDGAPRGGASRRVVGVCPQEIALYRDLTPGENLQFFAMLYGLSRAVAVQRIATLVEMFELAPYAHTPISALSGGWQRRVNIAAALVHAPKLLVLDEPTASLDLEARFELWQTLERLKGQGVTILLTTHHLDEAERLCTRIGIVKAGRIVKEGTVAELLAVLPAEAIAFVEAPDAGAIAARAERLGWPVRRYAGRIGCLLPRRLSIEAVVQGLSGLEVSSVAVQPVTLEHAYLAIVQEGEAPLISA